MTRPRIWWRIRVGIAALWLFFGGLGTLAGAGIFILGTVSIKTDKTEGPGIAMVVGALLFVVALLVLGVGLLLRHPRSTAAERILRFVYAGLWIGLVSIGLLELGSGDPSGWLYLAATLFVTGALLVSWQHLAASKRAPGGEVPGPSNREDG